MNKPDFRFIGKPIRRAEDERLITGRGQFSDDFLLEGQTYAAIVRSPYPHARIRDIDSRAREKNEGRARRVHRRRLPCRQARPDPARSAAEDQVTT